MKKPLSIIVTVFLFCITLNLFAEEPPIKSGDWHWDNGITLKGKRFYFVAESYKEQDGWAYIEGYGKIHYWLYDTYTYHDGDGSFLINSYVPVWIESMGYVIDFDHMRRVNPNKDLASSVKALMTQRNCDVSVALITSDSSYPYVVINSYDKNSNYYWTDIIPLIK